MKSKLSFLTITVLLFAAFFAKAQMQVGSQTLYGNEWIVDGQDYFKITVEEDGIYRLSYQTLTNAGVFSAGAVPTGEELKLYYQGQEIPLYVTSSGTLGTSDYIEFFGKKNTGKMDVHLYEEPEFQLNPLYSLFTDVSSYFLTWNSDPSSRISNTPNNLSNLPAAEPYCLYEDAQVYSQVLDRGKENGSAQWRCSYDIGEGFCKNTFSTSQNFTFDLEHLVIMCWEIIIVEKNKRKKILG